jgi:hypothetical protein
MFPHEGGQPSSPSVFYSRLPSGAVKWIARPKYGPNYAEDLVGPAISNYTNQYLVPASRSWNGISSKVSLTQVTSGSYQVSVTNDLLPAIKPVLDAYGIFVAYCIGPTGVTITGDFCRNLPSIWSSVQIIGYEIPMITDKFSTTNRIAVYTHEWGHTLSLRHNETGAPSIMLQGQKTIGPQAADKDHLRLKWGN